MIRGIPDHLDEPTSPPRLTPARGLPLWRCTTVLRTLSIRRRNPCRATSSISALRGSRRTKSLARRRRHVPVTTWAANIRRQVLTGTGNAQTQESAQINRVTGNPPGSLRAGRFLQHLANYLSCSVAEKRTPPTGAGEMPLLVQSGLGGLIAVKSFLNASGVSTSQATPFSSKGLTVYPQVITPTPSAVWKLEQISKVGQGNWNCRVNLIPLLLAFW